MSTRILQTDVADFVKNTLLNIRKGIEDANSAGLSAELPLEASFELEIVSSAQSLTQMTETTNPEEVTTEAPVTDVDTNTRDATQTTGDVGDDVNVQENTWDDKGA